MGQQSHQDIETRHVFCVGVESSDGQVVESIRNHLRNAFSEDEENCEWIMENYSSPEEAKKTLKTTEAPALTVIFPDEKEFPEHSSAWDELCEGLKTLDLKACILTLHTSGDVPPAEKSISWMDRGASGLLNPFHDPEHSFSMLRELLTLPLKQKKPRHARVRAVHKVNIRLSSFAQAIAAETLNIGTGGLFIRNVPAGVNKGDHIEFVLHFTDTVSLNDNDEERDPKVNLINEEESGSGISVASSDISGEGKVVWVRQTQQGDLPEGIGVQFTILTDENFKKIQDFIASHRVKAFIPKS